MIPYRHRVEPEPAHQCKFRNAEIRVVHEITDKGVAAVKQDNVLLRRPDGAEYMCRLRDPADRPVQMKILGAERIEM